MPTVLRIGGFRFHFYSHEPGEPPHIHVEYATVECKIWLDPVAVARNRGFKKPDLRRALTLVEEHRIMMLEAWNGYFGKNA
jgi:Domain of unknown function (DUF4160)